MWTLWTEVRTCRPHNLWGRHAPTTGSTLYANVLAAILQYFLCVFSPCVADGMRRLAHAQPHESAPYLARSPDGEPHAAPPAHARAARHPHGPANAALRGMPVVDVHLFPCEQEVCPWCAGFLVQCGCLLARFHSSGAVAGTLCVYRRRSGGHCFTGSSSRIQERSEHAAQG